MKNRKFQGTISHECELCRREFPMVISYCNHILCVNCFVVETNRVEEEYGKFQEDYSSLINHQ